MILQLFIYTCLALILIFLIRIYWKFIRPAKHIYDILRKQGVSSEPFVPLIGQTPELRRYRESGRLFEFHEKLTKKHGLIYLYFLGPYPRLSIQEPELIADILGRTQAHNYFKPADLSFRLKPLIGIHNLLVSNGEEHDRARKMLNPAFHFSNLQSMISIMTDETTKTIDILLQSSSSSKINLSKKLNALTLSIIASSAFGRSFETIPNAREIVDRAFTEVLAAIAYRASRMIILIPIISQLPYWGKDIIDRSSQDMSHFVDQIIADRRQGRSQSLCAGADLLDLLLSAVDNQGEPFTDQEIKDQTITFVLAGHETTSNLMAWAMYELMINPSVYKACQDEVDRILPNDTIPTSEHLNDLSIIEAVLQETLRLYPPAPFFVRQCINEQTIGSATDHPLYIPVGTTVLINTYAIHRRAEYWPRPNEFDYTRWLRDPVTGLKPKLAHPFCYLPFAAGPRNCIGQNFALLEAKVMLSMLIQRCHFELESGQKIIPEIRLTMRPKYGLFARISKR
jgi:cytochrome P450